MRRSATQLKEYGEEQRRQGEQLRMKVDSMLVVVNAAGKGDLTRGMSVPGEDAIGQMGTGLERFFADLSANIASIADTTHSLTNSAEELSAVSTQMSANA